MTNCSNFDDEQKTGDGQDCSEAPEQKMTGFLPFQKELKLAQEVMQVVEEVQTIDVFGQGRPDLLTIMAEGKQMLADLDEFKQQAVSLIAKLDARYDTIKALVEADLAELKKLHPDLLPKLPPPQQLPAELELPKEG